MTLKKSKTCSGREGGTVLSQKTKRWLWVVGFIICQKQVQKTGVEIRFNLYNSTFLFWDANGKFINFKPAQGISFNELAGDLGDFKNFLESVGLA